jgi:hypothetical protein
MRRFLRRNSRPVVSPRARLFLSSLEERAVPATITVTNNNDLVAVDGFVSLREALDSINGAANINADVVAVGAYGTADAINFSGVVSPIALASGQLSVSKAVTITGPGAALLTIQNTAAASATSRVFNLSHTAGLVDISGVTVTGGNVTGANNGGGINNTLAGNLTLTNVVVTGNITAGEGGGINNQSTGTLTLTSCTISANSTTAAASDGGGINNQSSGLINIVNSTLTGNSAGNDGGAMYTNAAVVVTISNTLVSGNTAGTNRGGGIYFTGPAAGSTITNTTVTLNRATTTGGGVFFSSTSNVTVSNSKFTSNTATTTGGGIHQSGGTVTVTSSVISGNSAGTNGGAINSAGTLNLNATSIDGNTAGTQGGGLSTSSTVNITAPAGTAGSTISNNVAPLGGGWNATAGTITVRNTTIAKNTATGVSGGGGINLAGATFNLQNSTVASNTANGAGATGGGFRRSSGTMNVSSALIADNVATAGGADGHSTVAAGVTITLNNSLIGTNVPATSNITFSGTGQQNVASGLDPAGLQLNGAPSGTPLTIALLSGSLAINAGNNTQSLTTDQRGTGFVRVAGSAADVGAFELPSLIPAANVGSFPTVTTPGGTLYTFTVVYSDTQSNIDLTTLDGNDITVTGPGGYSKNASFVSSTGAGKSVTATYTVPAPDNAVVGQFDNSDNGAYTVTMNANQVFDTDGTPNAVPAGTVGNFNIAVGKLYVVDTATLDEATDTDGKLSLREALVAANASTGLGDTITFDPTVFAGATTIALSVGELSVTDPVTITGTGAQLLTVNAAAAARIFNVALVTAGGTVAISNIRLTGGNVTGAGGAIIDSNAALSIANSILENNTATAGGGAIELSSGVTTGLTIANSILRNNTAAAEDGGAIQSNSTAATITITNSLISGNSAVGTASNGGGVYFNSGGTLIMTGTTVSGNVAGGTGNAGAGIYLFNTKATITNSTISNNTAAGDGGGIGAFNTTNLTLNNSTVFGNTAGIDGGGIGRGTGTPTIMLFSSTVAGNTMGTGAGPDIEATAVTANFSNIGDTTGAGTITGANNQNNVSPNLGALGNNGGFVLPDGSTIPTHLPGPVSILRNNGSDSLSLTTDQRGAGFPRLDGASVDIGAIESPPPVVQTPPMASASLPTPVTTAGGTFYTFTVTYTDADTNIDLTTVDDGDEVTVTGPGGYSQNGIYVSDTGAGKSVTVTYKVAAPDNAVAGVFDISDNGSYTVTMNGNQVFDTDTTPNAVPAGLLGNFTVAIPNFVVLNDNDSGFGSLRQTLADSNSIPGTDTITFDPAFFSTPRTIKLATGLTISDAVTITGPGAGFANVSGEGLNRVFSVDVATKSGQAVSISGLTISNGLAAGSGGGILNNDEALTLTNVNVSGNTASGNGAGISITAAAGSLTMTGSTISGNSATGLTSNGAGIFVGAASAVVMDRSSLSGNVAGRNGGGIYFFNGGALTVTNSTVSGNTALTAATGLGGGGIYFYGTATTFLVSNSTVSGNTANFGGTAGYGGGILLNAFAGPAVFQNNTIAFNESSKGGSGITSTAAVTISSTIVAGNTVNGVNAATSDVFFPLGATNVAGDNNLIGIQDIANNATFTGTGNLTGTLATPLDAKLAPLALNGAAAGAPLTHALLAGSPAINAGNNVAGLSFDERGTGFARVVGGTADIGAYEVQAAPSKVTSVVINAGTANLVQRSRVTNLRITFDSPVTIADVSKAFALSRDGGGSVTLSTTLSGGNTVADIIFTGGEVDAPPGNQTLGNQSLVNGKYTFVISAAEFTNGFDGGSGVGTNYTLASTSYGGPVTPATGIFRVFGDATGNGKVESDDFLAFRLSFLGTNDWFDYDGNGSVDSSTDLLQFRLNFLAQV